MVNLAAMNFSSKILAAQISYIYPLGIFDISADFETDRLHSSREFRAKHP
jgi:hypothetical protein